MFDGIGEKLKTIALLFFFFEAIVYIVLGVFLIDYSLLLGIAIIILGPTFGFIITLFTCGFGELIEKVTIIANNSEKISSRSSSIHSSSAQSANLGNSKPVDSDSSIQILNIPKRKKENK